MNGLMRRSKRNRYSITSSARARSIGGTMMSSAFAVFKLITSSSLTGQSDPNGHGCSMSHCPATRGRVVNPTRATGKRSTARLVSDLLERIVSDEFYKAAA